MNIGLECFAGCNTAYGFYSGFEGVFLNTKRTFFIKGAPGTGKSSLMKRLAARQKALGHTVHIFHCSSDPDSLDAVYDETLRASILDATSPHAYDPPVPGATGSLLSLGDCLNERELFADLKTLEEINASIRCEFEEAAGCLRAADSLLKRRLTPAEKHAAHTLAHRICPVSASPKTGSTRSYFLSAVTHMGKTFFENPFPKDGTVLVEGASACVTAEVMRVIAENCRLSGRDSILFLNEIDPYSIDHIYIPGEAVFITGDKKFPARETFSPVCREKQMHAETKKIIGMLVEKASGCMLNAKKLHDSLEKYYIPRMDFSRLVEAEARVIEAFDRL